MHARTTGAVRHLVEELIIRAHSVGEPFTHLEPELHDHALILVLNLFKDGLRYMPWSLEDLRRIVRQEQFDAEVLVSRAREGHVLSALWIVADWLSERESGDEWRLVRERVGHRPPSTRVAAVYRYVLARGWPPKPGLLTVATSNDRAMQSALGLALAVAGLARRRLSILDEWLRGRAGSSGSS